MSAPASEATARVGQDVPRAPRRKRARYVAIAVTAIALTGLASFGLRRLRASAPIVDRATVWTDTVKRGPMLREVQGAGALVPEQVRWLTATTPARVADVRARSGAVVKADTIVIVLENPDLVLQSLEADRQQAAAAAELVNLEATLRNQRLAQESAVVGLKSEAQETARRAEADDELAKRGFLSQLEMAQSRGRADALGGRLELESKRLGALDQGSAAQSAAQRAQVERLKSIAAFRKEQIEGLKVRAGVDGVLQDVPLQIGQWVTAGTMLAKVAQPERLKAELRVAETQAKDVLLGQRVAVDTRNGVAHGKVSRMDGAVQAGTVKIDVAFDEALPPGARPDLTIDGTIEIERLESVLYVGRPTIAQPNATVSLFKVGPDGEAVRAHVRLGRTSVKTVEIVSGLAEGETVILSDMAAWDAVDRVQLK